ncbi:MAG: hypothetical protein MUC54_07920, partial [Chloroflexi bacterium]|nr:hypothetical protein [Chloroflexota bacterium]
MSTPEPPLDPTQRVALDRVCALATDLAGAWSARARSSTTLARERAVLRLFGVAGLDRTGLPLASAVVERGIGGDRARLAAGIALPFAVALGEYEVAPQALAMDVASGAIDLSLEAELLRVPERRAAAEAEARRLVRAALERVDDNRTARRELVDVLGDAARPWLAASLDVPNLAAAPGKASALVEAGADVVRVHTPAVRELVLQLVDRGLEPTARDPRDPDEPYEDPTTVPAGSQRALSVLRARIDEAAAESGRYAWLATSASALAAPEQAIVAALERVDAVEADPLAEIVAGGVDPDRALADHSFLRRLLARAGTAVVVGAGPLVVAPDLARGVPSDPQTLAGRAFALQALAIALARADGLRSEQLLAGAFVPWLAEERDAATQALAAVLVRRAAWPDVSLFFDEPDLAGRARARWPFLLTLGLAIAGQDSVVGRRANAAELPGVAEQTRAAASVAAELASAGGSAQAARAEPVVAQVGGLLAAAETTLGRLADDGWRSVLGLPLGGPGRDRLGADAVVERSESFDPFELELAA